LKRPHNLREGSDCTLRQGLARFRFDRFRVVNAPRRLDRRRIPECILQGLAVDLFDQSVVCLLLLPMPLSFAGEYTRRWFRNAAAVSRPDIGLLPAGKVAQDQQRAYDGQASSVSTT
jgi:hypothetical protein